MTGHHNHALLHSLFRHLFIYLVEENEALILSVEVLPSVSAVLC